MKRVVLLSSLTLVGVLAVAVVVVFATTPSPTDLNARLAAHERHTGATPIALSDVAPVMRDAVVATEDERFYEHQGVDLIGVLRAFRYDIGHLAFRQGASTITEQLVKVLYFNGNDHAPWKKAQAAAVAVKLEGRYSKEQILGAYLNTVYFGAGAWGIAAASRTYFATRPKRLDIAQASLLAGLVQSPTRYDPFRDPQAARSRQVEVLRAMVQNGFATADEASQVAALPLTLAGHAPLGSRTGLAFAVRPELRLGRLLLGLALLGAGLVVLVRRRVTAPLWRVAAGASATTGLLVAAASYPFL